MPTSSQSSAATKLCEYNAGVIEPAEFDQHARALRKELMPDMAREIPIDPLGLSRETVASWVFPYSIRADILALRHQRRFRRLSWAIFVLAAAAVAVVAMQADFWPGLPRLAVLEVVCLVGLLFILVMDRGGCTTSGSRAVSWPSGFARAISSRWRERVTGGGGRHGSPTSPIHPRRGSSGR